MSVFSVRTCTCDNTTSPNIGETDAWAVPHLKFLGWDRPSSPPTVLPPILGPRHCVRWLLIFWSSYLNLGMPWSPISPLDLQMPHAQLLTLRRCIVQPDRKGLSRLWIPLFGIPSHVMTCLLSRVTCTALFTH